MEKLNFDLGVRSFRIGGGGVLRFNPADPNLYARFLQAAQNIAALESQLNTGECPSGEELLDLLSRLDGQVKQELNRVFGTGNDVDEALGGVNVLAVCGNGERVITNFLGALEPILTQGAKLCADTEAAKALNKRKERRG